MKVISMFFLFLIAISFHSYGQKANAEKYTLIKIVKKYNDKGKQYKMAVVDRKNVDRLNEPLKALATYYSCWIQSDCTYDSTEHIVCELTTALGLGQQGSDMQIALLRKWFPDDKDVLSVIDEHCWVGMPGSSNFLAYSSLAFHVQHDTVTVNYQYSRYEHGNTSTIVKKDIARIKSDRVVFIKR